MERIQKSIDVDRPLQQVTINGPNSRNFLDSWKE
jgi:hypothetical protein